MKLNSNIKHNSIFYMISSVKTVKNLARILIGFNQDQHRQTSGFRENMSSFFIGFHKKEYI